MFIIGLLIGILIPSLNAARNAAKKTKAKSLVNAINVGLDMFKGDHESEFIQTNGYPPSHAHPRMVDANGKDIFKKPELAEYPFLQEKPQVHGAHWLPMMLMGADGMGYISRKTIPKWGHLRDEPWLWYTPDPFEDGSGRQLERSPLYLDLTKVPTMATRDLPGIPNLRAFFPDWDKGEPELKIEMNMLPVIVDPWDQPILYYASNRNGRPSNMVEDKHDPTNRNIYIGQIQEVGPPYYFHEDNVGFTGSSIDPGDEGWDLRGGPHAIAESGESLNAEEIVAPFDEMEADKYYNFARFILDPKIRRALEAEADPNPLTPLKPVNPDTYLLLSPGVDARWGTRDDVTNFAVE